MLYYIVHIVSHLLSFDSLTLELDSNLGSIFMGVHLGWGFF